MHGLIYCGRVKHTELEGWRRNIPSKRGAHLISIKLISCVFATFTLTYNILVLFFTMTQKSSFIDTF